MNVRSVTCFVSIGGDFQGRSEAVRRAGDLARQAKAGLESGGFPVQTLRLATQPLSQWTIDPVHLVPELWAQSAAAGFDYLSVGPVLADSAHVDLSRLEQIPDLIRTTEAVFAAVLVARQGRGIHLGAIRQVAHAIREIAHTTPQGFGNLRLAALANVLPHTPFFPAAYHDGGSPALALATESADLAVEAFAADGPLVLVQERLRASVEAASTRMVALVRPLAERLGCRFAGIDFSLAPFPEDSRSIGAAVERLGVERFGASGTLFAAALLTDCLRRADYPRCGFSGLMLPVLEDLTLATRSREGLFGVSDLLLYSAVCGTGLDIVPLPGDVSEEELAGILLDVAALALRLDKPLTARLMPVPGKKAGDATEFDFSYFANGRILDTKGFGSRRLFERGDWLAAGE
jgi:uncharacterized protein (UPF0210 family)